MSLTNPSRSDGFGAQFQTIIGSLVYARVYDLKFYYTPFEKMEHDYENDPQFLDKKEEMIGWKSHFPIANGKVPRKSAQEIVFFMDHLNWNNLKAQEALEEIKTIFWKSEPQIKMIAVHIRRRNIHDSRDQGTQVPDDHFLKVIEKTQKEFPELPVHIFSQGKLFCERYIKYTLHIDESVEETFSSLVKAQVLITSPSSLSYSAALLSQGTVYFTPFWHQPLPHWKIIK